MSAPTDIWSRRRAAVQAESEADARAVAAAAFQEEQAKSAEKTDAEILAELNLKDPDEMQAGDDFAAFMKAAVPERLRRRALRKLWLSDPMLANMDGLVDYADDFTDSATVVKNLKTAYQVGRGFLKHIEALEKSAAESAAEAVGDDEPVELDEPAELAEAAAPPQLNPAETAGSAPSVTGSAVEIPEPAGQGAAPSQDDDELADQMQLKRKMRFQFAGDAQDHPQIRNDLDAI